ncbi:MAG: SGNH/GDSL hydrolase family protein [Dehalococcoidia bacterium]|jgi:lysophospholipase L1-like esterase
MRRFGALLALAALLVAAFSLLAKDAPNGQPSGAAGVTLPTPTSQPNDATGAALPTPMAQPSDTTGIAFVGDSVTLGWYASSLSKSFYGLVARAVLGSDDRQAAHVFISVDPATDLAAASDAAKDNSHFVIIELGVHATGDDTITPDAFRLAYGALLDCLVGGDTIAVAGTVPWLGWEAGSERYARAAQFSQIIIEEAARKQVAVADLWSATSLRRDLLSKPEDSTFVWPYRGDNSHPGDAGHAVIAQLYENALASELANPPERPYEKQCR